MESGIDEKKLSFMRGVMALVASNNQVIQYNEFRRICRLSPERMGAALDEARQGLANGEPDLCAVVINDDGTPGAGWGDRKGWTSELRRVHQYWAERRRLDNKEFYTEFGALPAYPGVKE